MKILYSPSEAKSTLSPIKGHLKDTLSFPDLYSKREVVINKYNNFLKKSSNLELSKLLGLKKEADILVYKSIDIFKSPLQYAVLRYSGVGYNYLDFSSLNSSEKDVIFESLLIFSNLFGPLKANDKIPLYKIKQGELIGDFDPYKYYKEHFSSSLDKYIKEDLVIDLRAGFYEKLYSVKVPKITFKFLKNGKVVSHYAKAYRGIIARTLAIHNPQNEKEFHDILIPNLKIKEIQKKGNNSLYIYDIFD